MSMDEGPRGSRSAERAAASAPAIARDGAGGGTSAEHQGLLAEILGTRGLTDENIRDLRALGAAEADRGTSLHVVLADFFACAHRVRAGLAGSGREDDPSGTRDGSAVVLGVLGDAAVALSEGYETAHRAAIRREEAGRREFVDDLLEGRTPLGQLAERAERFGLRLVGPHRVAVARARTAFEAGAASTRYVEDGLTTRFGVEHVLITTKDGLLVCVASGTVAQLPELFAAQAGESVTEPCRVAVSRPRTGPSGIVRSYQEARRALDTAAQLGLGSPVVNASDLLVFQVLGRDRAAISDLVLTVLGGLAQARGGPEALLETLTAYFAAGCGNTTTARRMGVGVRTVGYRIARIRELTGYDPTDPDQRYVLQTAVLGARLLGWPESPLQSAD
ncbi:PucR family transcriptional regulator [Streptomyces sp. WMMC940]|uniref:PucR family transcriptional regulator n=1 Tax=Streptomyces sp. WMMC940 TaxID=3015153 RepID=UPI0022B6BD7A|nr:helix-turn-helix domain-containing protein [Streptomyces sp. WMMC940]MCZ7461944.1 helix-turn-helix domain-containing protein [Streptomyces sp. WMMC940]